MKSFITLLRDWITPTANNNFFPRALSFHIMTGIALVASVLFLGSVLITRIPMDSDSFLASVISTVLVDLTNEVRLAEQSPRLASSTLLDDAATLKARHMAENGYFSHMSPDGVTPWYWFDAVGYEYRYAGENLAVHFSDSARVVRAWMNSPSHRSNIIDPRFSEIGIGIAEGSFQGRPTVFVVQLFAQPVISSETTQTLAQGSSTSTRAVSQDISLPQTSLALDSQASGSVLGAQDTTTHFERIIASPLTSISTTLKIIIACVTLILALTLVIEIRIQHWSRLLYGLALLFVLITLWIVLDVFIINPALALTAFPRI
jgi:hypothetical protein